MDTEQGAESTQAETTEPQGTEAEASSKGTQPSDETTIPQRAPEQHDSEPTVPYSRLAEVIRERNELRNAVKQQQFQQAPTPAPQAPANDAPKPDQFETYEAFIEAKATHTAERAAEKRFNDLQRAANERGRQNEEQSREQKAGASFVPKWNAEVAKDPTLASKPQDHLGDLPRELAIEIMSSEHSGAVMAHLVKNPAEVYRLSGMTALQAGREVERLERTLSGSTRQPPQTPSKNIPSIDPVRTGTGKGSKRGDDMSQDDVLRRLYPH